MVSMGGKEEEEAWQSGLGIPEGEGGRKASAWNYRREAEGSARGTERARLTYARCKFLSIVRYDVRGGWYWRRRPSRRLARVSILALFRFGRGERIELRVVWKSS